MLSSEVLHRLDVNDIQLGLGHGGRRDDVLAGLEGGRHTAGVSATVEHLRNLFAAGCVRSIAFHPSRFQNVKTATRLAFHENELIASEAQTPPAGTDGRACPVMALMSQRPSGNRANWPHRISEPVPAPHGGWRAYPGLVGRRRSTARQGRYLADLKAPHTI